MPQDLKKLSYSDLKAFIEEAEKLVELTRKRLQLDEALELAAQFQQMAMMQADKQNLKGGAVFDFYGQKFKVIEKTKYLAGKDEFLFPFLKQNFPGTVKETVHYQTLTSTLKNVDEATIKDLVSKDALKVKTERNIKEEK